MALRVVFLCAGLLHLDGIIRFSVAEVSNDIKQEIGGFSLSPEQIEAARKLAAEARASAPVMDFLSSQKRPMPRPPDIFERQQQALSRQVESVALEDMMTLVPPARLVGRSRDIPLRKIPSMDAMVVVLVRNRPLLSEVMTGNWYMVTVDGEVYFTHRDDVMPAPR